MIKFIAVLAAFFAIATTHSLIAQEKNDRIPDTQKEPSQAMKKMQATGSEMMKYYLDPEPEKIAPMLETIGQLQPEEAKNVMSSAIIFFGEVFRANPDKNAEWVEINREKRVMQFVIVNALSYADTEVSRKILNEYIKSNEALSKIRLPEKPMTDITLLPMSSPTLLDACWGGFFASGDKKYIEAVIKCALRETPESTIDMTSAAAKWSVLSLSNQQPQVKAVTKAYLAEKASKEEKTRFAKGMAEEKQIDLLGAVIVPQNAQNSERNETASGTK